MKAVFAGTFDPFTVGHLDIVTRAQTVFGDVIIAVAEDTGKTPASLSDRLDIVNASVRGLNGVSAVSFSGLLSDFVKSLGQCVLVRGLRNIRDYEYERDIAAVYKTLCGVDTVYFTSSPCAAQVSSTIVRELAALGAPLADFAASGAVEKIKRVYGKKFSDKE